MSITPPARVTSIRLTKDDKLRIKRLRRQGWGTTTTEVIRKAVQAAESSTEAAS